MAGSGIGIAAGRRRGAGGGVGVRPEEDECERGGAEAEIIIGGGAGLLRATPGFNEANEAQTVRHWVRGKQRPLLRNAFSSKIWPTRVLK